MEKLQNFNWLKNNNEVLESLHDEYQELNNELIVPAYRKFCQNYNLPFHFWNQFPENAQNSEISIGEFELHKEALKLFNILKPEIVVYKNKAVRFQFSDWGGTFSYDAVPLDEFLKESADRFFYLNQLEARYKSHAEALALIFSCSIFIASMMIIMRFSPWEFLNNLCYIPCLGLGVPLFYLVNKYFNNTPKKILDDGKIEGLSDRLDRLRKKLEELNRSGANSPN